MGFFSTKKMGKYQLGRTIGEGTFAKVKMAIDTSNGNYVAIKIIDKSLVLLKRLQSQVKREIRTMKLLDHPNIVRIHEVIGTKTKICIVMEYIPGGQLSDKLAYGNKMKESEARTLFQQLIDAVDYCHSRGVFHRDLKPQNLLLDAKGNLKVSDFGLSAVPKSGDMLSTACGSPCYLAPELLLNKGYYSGAAVDVWSCGVILFELLAGYPPFDDQTLTVLYKKILRADFIYPPWFNDDQKKLIYRILEPNPQKRITIPEIIQDPWFRINYAPTYISVASNEESGGERNEDVSSRFINAFQLIAMCSDLDLSGLFEEQDDKKYRKKIGSKHTAQETIKKIEAAATNVSLSVERMKQFKMKIHEKEKRRRCSRSCCDLSAEVIEVTPTNCVIEIAKTAGESTMYVEFCQSLSSLLTEDTAMPLPLPSQKREDQRGMD